MNKHEEFLSFNGTTISFVSVDGVFYIALRPMCEALKVDYIRSYKNAKNDAILGSVLSEQTMQVSKNGKTQGRKMTCVPERYIYGWLFSLRSDSKDLISYKRTCYDLMFSFFHGTSTDKFRKDLIIQQKQLQTKIEEKVKNSEDVVEIKKMKSEIRKISLRLKKNDDQLAEPDLFSDLDNDI